MSQQHTISGRRSVLIWLSVLIVLVVAALLAVTVLFIYPNYQRQQQMEQHYQAGVAFQDVGDWDKAVEAFERVIAIDATYKDARTRLAEVKAKQKEATTLQPTPLHIYTDESWLTYHEESPGWESLGFDDSTWTSSSIVTYYLWSQLKGMDPKAVWIWNPNASLNVPIFFRKKFTLNALPASASLRISGDNAYKVFVNGSYIGEDTGENDSWKQAEDHNVIPYLVLGSNVIAVQVIDFRAPGGLVASLTIVY